MLAYKLFVTHISEVRILAYIPAPSASSLPLYLVPMVFAYLRKGYRFAGQVSDSITDPTGSLVTADQITEAVSIEDYNGVPCLTLPLERQLEYIGSDGSTVVSGMTDPIVLYLETVPRSTI